MKNYLLRFENLLLIVPLLLFVFNNIQMGESVLDIHSHDANAYADSVFNISFLIVFICGFIFLPYPFHFYLRLKDKTNPIVCATHVLTTLILILLLYIFFYTVFLSDGMPRRFFEYKNVAGYSFSEKEYSFFIYPILLIIILHFLFILYFGFKISKKSNSNS